ncbi:tetratricopeptide repeat protein [Streptomyces sp. NPDC057939]|uniref:tetratricopeptide repeat protein n=1 Tax=Streptomyces sp. NPDC057939 TaxID=3346284 RepID=UPI0036EA20CC
MTYVAAPPRGVNLPHQVGVLPRQADCFQQRAALRHLNRAFGPDEADNERAACLVLTGLGGVGKTQIAAHHAREVWRAGHVDLLVWITAGSREAVVSAYAQAATEVLGTDASDPTRAAQAFLAWLEPNAASPAVPWLVILDDLRDPADLRGLWPPVSPCGRTLVTTRRRDAALTGTGRRLVPVGLFTPAEAVAHLSDVLASHDRTEPLAQLTALAEDLGRLPLALSQAAAYLVDTDLDCAAYRALLSDRGPAMGCLLPDPAGLPDDQSTSAAAAWSLSIDRADQLPPAGLARPMLQLLSVLDPNGIPAVALTCGPALDHLTRAAPGGGYGAQDAVQALRALHRLSLIDHTPAQPHRVVRVHQLVQRTTRESLDDEGRLRLGRDAADALLAAWPGIERDPQLAEALRANAAALLRCAEDALFHGGTHPLLLRMGQSLGESGRLGEAIAHHRQLEETSRGRLGPLHPDTLTARHELAQWIARAGDPVESAELFATLVADRERVLGPDHPDTLLTRGSLTQRIGEAGDPAAAVAGFAVLLVDMSRVLGPDHPYTVNAMHIQACWRGEAGDEQGAVTGLLDALERMGRVLGPDHPRTLTARHDTARWRMKAGLADRAVLDLEELLADRERVLGRDHPDTLLTRHHLARFRGFAGDAAGAVSGLEELIPDLRRVLGEDHLRTLSARHSLAEWMGRGGDAQGAVAGLRSLLADITRLLGSDHRRTLNTRLFVADWQGWSGDVEGAVAALEELRDHTARSRGVEHRRTLLTRAFLVEWRGRLAGPELALTGLEELLADMTRIRGADDPHTLRIRDRLAEWRAGTPPWGPPPTP